MKEKLVLIRVVPDAEIIGTAWHLNAMVFCSLNVSLDCSIRSDNLIF